MAPIEATSADEFLFFKHSLSKLSRLLCPNSHAFSFPLLFFFSSPIPGTTTRGCAGGCLKVRFGAIKRERIEKKQGRRRRRKVGCSVPFRFSNELSSDEPLCCFSFFPRFFLALARPSCQSTRFFLRREERI
jgi:hypothetical protein